MAKEPDQTRWVGIRPTDPSEDIPTTTKKVLPAVGDLQAIKENIGGHIIQTNQDCSVSIAWGDGVVLATEIWVITNMTMYNKTSMCDMIMKVNIGAVLRQVKQFSSYDVNIYGSWNGFLVLELGDSFVFEWQLGGATDDITAIWHGYKIGVY